MIPRLASRLAALTLLASGPVWAQTSSPEATPAPASQTNAQTPANAAPNHPNAGFGNEAFFIRSDDDNFIFIPSGRLQYDFYAFQGGTRQPFNTWQVKRARIELFGTLMKHWDFQVAGELTSASAPIATDVYLNANYTPYANVQLGQFDAPFTLSNRTSDKWFDMQERPAAVRAFAIPENKLIGAMVWGQPEQKWAYWSLGVFNGEGQNLPQRDNAMDVIGRAWIAPGGLAGADAFKNVWVGGSFWTGNRAPSVANQVDRPAMRTQGGFTFFNPVAGTAHTGYFGALAKWGLELNAPLGPVVLKAEYIHSSEGMREVSGGAAVRNATLSGSGFYARASWFVWGDSLINGLGGMQNPNRLFGALKPGKTQDALQLVLQYDRVAFDYTAADGADNATDPFVGNYGYSDLGVGVNYWYTKHLRLTGNFLYNFFDGQAAHPLLSANTSYELSFRVALAL